MFATLLASFLILISPQVGRVSGVVIAADSSPITGAVIEGVCGSQSFTINADVQGRFNIKDIAPGKCQVKAWTAGFTSDSKDLVIKAGEELSVKFTLTLLVQFNSVDSYIRPILGDDPLNCGRMSRGVTVEDLKRALMCVAGSPDGKTAFALREIAGIDTVTMSGVMKVRGAIFVFFYDRSPCGGSNCASTFQLSVCPTVTVDDLGTYSGQFVCRIAREAFR